MPNCKYKYEKTVINYLNIARKYNQAIFVYHRQQTPSTNRKYKYIIFCASNHL